MPANDYYDSTNVPATGAAVTSATLRAEYNLIELAFNKCPPLTGNGGKVVIVNAGGTALTADSFASLASAALALKANIADAIFTGLTTIPQLKLDATTLTVSGAELNFVDGVTSAIQTQLNAKAPLTGTAAGLTAGNVTTNANLTGPVTSVGNATAIADAALSIAKTSGLQAALDAKALLAGSTGQAFSVSTLTAATSVLSTGSGGVGYGTGAGGTVTQATSKSTLVTLNKTTGVITTAADALLAATTATFRFSNSTIGQYDVVVVSIGKALLATSYQANVTYSDTGEAYITIKNISAGSLSEAVPIKFAVIKGVAS